MQNHAKNSAFNGAALATAPKASNSAMKMTFESEIGAQPPIGFWDPLGLVADADQERFDRLRYVEIKHGRIAMLAVAGHLTQQNVRLPGMLSFKDNISFEDVPNGLAAFSKIPPLGTLQIILAIGVHELFVVKQVRVLLGLLLPPTPPPVVGCVGARGCRAFEYCTGKTAVLALLSRRCGRMSLGVGPGHTQCLGVVVSAGMEAYDHAGSRRLKKCSRLWARGVICLHEQTTQEW